MFDFSIDFFTLEAFFESLSKRLEKCSHESIDFRTDMFNLWAEHENLGNEFEPMTKFISVNGRPKVKFKKNSFNNLTYQKKNYF